MWGFPASFSGKLLHPHFERVSRGRPITSQARDRAGKLKVKMFKKTIELKFSKFNMQENPSSRNPLRRK